MGGHFPLAFSRWSPSPNGKDRTRLVPTVSHTVRCHPPVTCQGQPVFLASWADANTIGAREPMSRFDAAAKPVSNPNPNAPGIALLIALIPLDAWTLHESSSNPPSLVELMLGGKIRQAGSAPATGVSLHLPHPPVRIFIYKP